MSNDMPDEYWIGPGKNGSVIITTEDMSEFDRWYKGYSEGFYQSELDRRVAEAEEKHRAFILEFLRNQRKEENSVYKASDFHDMEARVRMEFIDELLKVFK